MRRRMELGIYRVLVSSQNWTCDISVEIMGHFRVLQSGSIDVNEEVGEDVHIHVLLETRSDDEILKRSYEK